MDEFCNLDIRSATDNFSEGPREKLDWGLRYKLALGTAHGLQYPHEGCQRRIIHKDSKAANILLSEDFEAQISDFGLSKWLPKQWTHHTVLKVEGTFGVLLLELITGKQAIDSSQQSLVMWAKPLFMKDKIKELVDPVLADAFDVLHMKRLVLIASSCIHQSSTHQPQMHQVLEIPSGNNQVLEEIKQLQQLKHLRTYSEEVFDVEEYNSTKHLSDLNRHMEIVLGNDESSDITEDTLQKIDDISSQSES